MPTRWLLKTEPSTFSFADLREEGRSTWDGVTNPTALANLRAMREGDEVLVYHTGSEKAVVGTAKVVRAAYADPKGKDPRLVVVDLEAGAPLARPVSLAELRARPELASWELLRISRLSVMPVPAEAWKAIRALASARGTRSQ